MNDYVAYIDTDSCYISIYNWLKDNGIDENTWEKIPQDKKIDYVKHISNELEQYTNEQSYNITQKQHYNSDEEDFKIVFEQEKIALSALFVTKKRYATWTLLDEGTWKDDMSVTGLEIIRSDSPEIVKPMIKNVLKKILKSYGDDDIRKYISQCKKKLKVCKPSEIAENKGINKLDKYELENFGHKKGTPHQIKGVINFKMLCERLELVSDLPMNGNKAKVIYVKNNAFNVSSLSFINWPNELDSVIQVDFEKMVHNNYVKKIEKVLKLVGKENLLSNDMGLF